MIKGICARNQKKTFTVHLLRGRHMAGVDCDFRRDDAAYLGSRGVEKQKELAVGTDFY